MTRLRYPVAVAALVALTVLFITNRRYVYSESLGLLPALTAAHIVDPRHAGATFRLEGRVISVRATRQGIVIIETHDPAEDLYVDVPVFPSLGCLPLKPVRGEAVRVTGNLGMYAGQPQIRPLSAPHVEVLDLPGDPVSAAAAAEQVGATLLIGPVVAVDAEFFESRAGLEHLRLTLADAGEPAGAAGPPVEGILFQGEQTDCEVDLLLSNDPFLVTAEVEMFQGAPSFNVRRAFPLDAW
ncbi:MAG: hypothetical protein F4Y45_13825 [Acidobacteria bacterium]|nr:hypothetical protein [Acidobacteriota bacterium]MYJ06136.1 hypothetical protein [Acidobacteriota bacterium]